MHKLLGNFPESNIPCTNDTCVTAAPHSEVREGEMGVVDFTCYVFVISLYLTDQYRSDQGINVVGTTTSRYSSGRVVAPVPNASND